MRWLKVILLLILAITCYAIGSVKGLFIAIVLGLLFEGLMWFIMFRKMR